MKLYVIERIVSHNDIVAISESKFMIYDFFIQNNLGEDYYRLKKIKNDKVVESYLLLYDDLYVEDLYGFSVLRKDYIILNGIIEEYRNMINSTIKNLNTIRKDTLLTTKESNSISKTLKILLQNNKRKNIDEFIDIKQLIFEYYNIDGYRYYKEIYSSYFNTFNN